MLFMCNRRSLDVWIFIVRVGCSYFSMLCHFLPLQEKQARIASLYLPLYGLILDNMPRFFLRDLFPIYFTSSDQVSLSASSFQPPLPPIVWTAVQNRFFTVFFVEQRALCESLLHESLHDSYLVFQSDPVVSLSLWFSAAHKSDHQLNWESSNAFDYMSRIEIWTFTLIFPFWSKRCLCK